MVVTTRSGAYREWGQHVGTAQRTGGNETDALVEVLLALETPEEARLLLGDLCTPRELEDLTQRIEVARMLDSGVSYARIQEATGASATTVARVARCLKYGPGGYRAVLDKLVRDGSD